MAESTPKTVPFQAGHKLAHITTCLNNRDVEHTMDDFAENCVVRLPGAQTETFKGKDGLKQWLDDDVAHKAHIDILGAVETSANRLEADAAVNWTQEHNGKQVTRMGNMTIHLDDVGKIKELIFEADAELTERVKAA